MVWAVVIVVVAGFLAGCLVALTSEYLLIKEDPRRQELLAALPGVDCGACGHTGCAAYAAAMAEGEACNLCVPGGKGAAAQAEAIMAAPPEKQA